MKKIFTILLFIGVILVNHDLIRADELNNNIPQSGTSTSPAPKGTPIASPEQKCLPLVDPIETDSQNGMDKFDEMIHKVGCSINSVLREFNDDARDLMVKVPGGHIPIDRQYRDGKWYKKDFSHVFEGRFMNRTILIQVVWEEENSTGGIVYPYGNWEKHNIRIWGVSEYLTKGGIPYYKVSENTFKQGTNTIEIKTDTGTKKYLCKDKFGNWELYDFNGRFISWGNRLGTIASYIYDSTEDQYPSGIADKNDNQVIWYEYDIDGNPVRVFDADARQVRYEYTDGNLTKVIDAPGNETVYTYDGKYIIKKVDAQGRATNITYNKSDDPISVTDSSGTGHFFDYDYDKNKKEYYAQIKATSGMIKEVWYNDKGETKQIDINGRTIKKIIQNGRDYIIVDEKKNQTRKEYDEKENLTKIIYPDGSQAAFEYDLRFNKVKTIEDQLGRVTAFEYDDTGNLIKKTEAKDTALERITSFTYDDQGQILTATIHADQDTEETVTTFTYDAKGNLASITDPLNQDTQFLEYDNTGNLLKMKDAKDQEWLFEYDAIGRMKSQTNPMGDKTSFEYDGANNRTAVINAYLKRFEFEYDDHNNLIKAIDPHAKYITTQYNTDHLPTLVTDREGKQSSALYDNEGRIIKSTDGAGNEISYTYDASLATPVPSTIPVSITYPTFTRNFIYDSMGRVIKQEDILDAGTTHTKTYTYDLAGSLASSTDEENSTTSYEYDDLNRLIKTTNPDNQEIIRTFDNRNNLIMLQDPNQGMQYFSYDKNNRVIRSAKPMGEETTYEYDATGNKTAVVDAKNQRIEYSYNAVNRLTQVRYYTAGSFATPVKTVDFTYDKLGNILTYNDGTTSGTYTYDDLSRKLSETVNYGTFSLTHTSTYYANGAKKSFTGPDNNTITYDYDEGNRLAGINIPTRGQISYTYNTANWNSPASMLLPGGSKQDYTYDPLMRLKTITAKDPGQNPLMTRDYTYSPAGNITAKATEHGNHTYAYDNLNQLTTALNPTLADEAYTYDNLGNRITDVKIPGTLTYNANNELTGFADTAFVYDNNGNMTQKNVAGVAVNYTYDVEDRLTRVEDTTGVVATYYYDPFGRRLWKDVAGTRTYFHYANEGLIGEYDETGTEIKTYGYKPGSIWTTDPLFMKIGSEYYWYQNDHAGTPQKLIATNGLVVWDGKYDAFGNCQIEIEAITNNLRFAGQYYDAETGLHYNLNRYYDLQLGRYLRADPFGDGLNLYTYCLNNTNTLIDPLGLCAVNSVKEKSKEILDSIIENYLNWTIFAPDYFALNINIGIPWTGNLLGISGQVVLDRYGNLYWGAGPTVGKALTFVSGSLTGGYHMTGYRTEEKLKEFLSDHSVNIGGGAKYGGEFTFNQYGAAYEVGLYSPQFGGGYHYSWQKGKLPFRW